MSPKTFNQAWLGSFLPHTNLLGSLHNTQHKRKNQMRETTLSDTPDAQSPAGADIRFIMDGTTGNMIHSTVRPGQTNRATVHATVSEFWHVLEGEGEIWRKFGTQERTTPLVAGVSIDIPVGTSFQYRNTGPVDLKFICIAMPKWPGDTEATYVDGIWQASSYLTAETGE